MRYPLLMCLVFVSTAMPVWAEVFRCVDADGKVGFRDDRCPTGEHEHKVDMSDRRRNPQLKEALASQSLAPGAGARVNRDNLLGIWCAYGLSNDGKNRYQDDDPGVWNFKDYRQMSFTVKSNYDSAREMFSDYRLDNTKIISSNKLVGDWDVVEFSGSTMTLQNGLGYQYLRKGLCF